MKKLTSLETVLLASVCLSSQLVHANIEGDNLFSMSIEELLQIETDVAGFTSETIGTSPSIVTVFSNRDIQAYGVDNVYDLMNFVPGFQASVGEKVGTQTKLQSRGVYLDNGYVLVMVDGVKINEISFGKASVFTPFVDLTHAERVEIIRGPGSAVYGSNAFLGVINIITKKDNYLKGGVGSNSEKRFSFGLTEQVFDGELAANFSYIEGDGAEYRVFNHQTQQDDGVNKPYEHQQFALSWANKNIEVGYRTDEHHLDGFINLNGFHPQNYYRSENQYWYSKFNYTISDKTKLSGDLHHAEHTIESAGFITGADIAPFSRDVLQGPYWGTESTSLQAMLNHQYNVQLQFSLGVELQRERQDLAGVVTTHVTHDKESFSPAIDIYYQDGLVRLDKIGDFDSLVQDMNSKAFFGEVQWQIDSNQRVYIGGRYEDYDELGDAFSPRLSFIRTINADNQLKAIYSQAFRAPVTNELYSNDSVTLGNRNLNPELVETTELQWLTTSTNYSVETTLFHTQMDDLIVSKEIENGNRTTFVNSGSDNVTGLEVLGNLHILDNLAARATYTYYFNDTIEGQYDYFATGSLFWEVGKWQANMHLIYHPSATINQNDYETLYHEKSQLLVNLSLQYKMGRNLSLSVVAQNLGNNDYNGYEPRQSLNDYSMPQPKRHFSVSALYAF